MKIILTIFWLTLSVSAFCQDISHHSQTSASGFAKTDQGLSVDWSMGVSFSQVIQSDHHLTEGFHQGNLANTNEITDTIVFRQAQEESITETLTEDDIHFQIFPNPTSDFLYLRNDNANTQELNLVILNADGSQVLKQRVSLLPNQKTDVNNIINLPSGFYFIQINSLQSTLKTLKFIKQ